jgi:hypothetical protein
MKDASQILIDMAQTYMERNKVYGDNYKRVGDVMKALFPNGVAINTPEQFTVWHLFELMVVKMTRFANTGLSHQDSIHDLAVYAAMVESLITPPEAEPEPEPEPEPEAEPQPAAEEPGEQNG